MGTTRIHRLFNLRSSRNPLFTIISQLICRGNLSLARTISRFVIRRNNRVTVVNHNRPRRRRTVHRLTLHFPKRINMHVNFGRASTQHVFTNDSFLLVPSHCRPYNLDRVCTRHFNSLPITHGANNLTSAVRGNIANFLFSRSAIRDCHRTINHTFGMFTFPSLLGTVHYHTVTTPFG